MRFFYLTYRKLLQLLILKPIITNRPDKFEIIGNDYGFMIVPKGLLNNHSNVLSFGVGEDMEAEIDLVDKYNSNVFLFDPTELSVKYYNETIEMLKNNNKMGVVNKFKFEPIALWNNDGFVKFYKPKEEGHVSHSINNIESSNNFTEVVCKKMSSILKKYNLLKIDYVKLDIEGAEFDVVKNIIEDKIEFKSIYLELHYDKKINLYKNVARFKHLLNSLINNNYEIIYSKHYRYFCLIKKEV